MAQATSAGDLMYSGDRPDNWEALLAEARAAYPERAGPRRNNHRKREAARFKAFVNRSLDELHCGLKLDNGDATSSKGKIAAAFEARKDLTRVRNAAQLVLEGRFLLGADDAAYLASGLGLLWCSIFSKTAIVAAAPLPSATAAGGGGSTRVQATDGVSGRVAACAARCTGRVVKKRS